MRVSQEIQEVIEKKREGSDDDHCPHLGAHTELKKERFPERGSNSVDRVTPGYVPRKNRK